MRQILMSEESLAWLIQSLQNNVVALDDFDKHFTVLANLNASTDAVPTPQVTAVNTEEDLFIEAVIDAATPVVPAESSVLATTQRFREMFIHHTASAHFSPADLATALVTTPEGHYILADGTVVKEAPPGFGSCLEFTHIGTILDMGKFVSSAADGGTGMDRTKITAFPGSHYAIRKQSNMMEIDKFSADLLFAFMHYHRSSMR